MIPTRYPIALVEDDASFRRAISRLLRAEGFEVQTYASAEEFLAQVSPENWFCLILDIQLPGISGIELLSHLSSLGPARPAIFVTAQDSEEIRSLVSRTPGCALLLKPVSGTELVAAIQRQFELHEATVGA